MAGKLQPLDQKFSIVDDKGNPSEYFIRWAQQRQKDIGTALTLPDLKAFLTAHMLRHGSGIQITPDGDIGNSPLIAADVQEILDQLSATRGVVIYRGLLGWTALIPGTATYLLQTNGPGADPTWVPPPSGGGGGSTLEIAPTKPLVANFSLLNAGASVMAGTSFGIKITNLVASGQLHFVKANTPIASTTFTITVRSRGLFPFSGGNYQAAIMLRNSTNGRMMVFGNDNSEARTFASIWGSFSSFAANIFNGGDNPAIFPWARIVCVAGAISFDMSVDGETWWTLATTTLAGYITAAGGTVDEAGFGIYSNAGTLCQSYVQV